MDVMSIPNITPPFRTNQPSFITDIIIALPPKKLDSVKAGC
jgi:hypothetical protein